MGKGKWIIYVIGAVVLTLCLMPVIFQALGVWSE